jgi:hypothetical protein
VRGSDSSKTLSNDLMDDVGKEWGKLMIKCRWEVNHYQKIAAPSLLSLKIQFRAYYEEHCGPAENKLTGLIRFER